MIKTLLTIFASFLFLTGFQPLFAGSTGDYPAYTGNKRIAIIMLSWKDRGCPASRQLVVDRVWNYSKSVRKYYRDMSRNLLDFIPPSDAANGVVPSSTKDVFGPYELSIAAGFDKDITVDNADSYYAESPRYLSNIHPVARTLASQRDGFKAEDYDYIMYVTPTTSSTGNVKGYARVNGTYSHMYDMRQNYVNHEIGHNLGLHHSNTSIDRDGYGSQDCVMGNNNNPHLDSVHTYNMGWYPDANFGMKTYGQYTIENLAQPNTDNLKVLRFDRGAHGASFKPKYNIWVGYRVKDIGQDAGLNDYWNGKVNIHFCVGASMRPQDPWGNLDESRGKYFYYNNNVATFDVNGSYTDPDNVCKIKFLRKDYSGNASAIIQLIDPNGNQPPSIPANQTVTVSAQANQFTITANDPENNSLEYTVINQPASGNITVSGNTFTYTGSQYKTYTFKVRVNDGQYDSYDQTITLKYASPNPPLADAGIDQQIYLSGNAGVLWSPEVIGATLWYDGSDLSTITANQGAVSQWNNKINNGLNLTVKGGSPKSGQVKINNLNTVNFSGAYMTTASNPFGSSVDNAFVIAVHRVNAIQNGSLFSLTGDAKWKAHAPWSNGYLFFDTGATGGMNRVSTSYGVSSGTVAMTSFYGSTSANVQQVYKNGSLLVADSSGHSVNTTGNILVGGDGNVYQSTSIGEIIVLNGTVNAEDRKKLEGYLAHKWGLSAKLPANHPYKNSAPSIGGSSVAVNLNGTVSDPDGDTPSTAWSFVSGPDFVFFDNTSSLTTKATFIKAGTYTLRLTANDGGNIASDDVVITVNETSGGNTAPVANNSSVTTDQDTSVAATLSASDTENNDLSYAIVSAPANGTLSGTAQNLTYRPNSGFFGSDSFSFKVNDGSLDSNTATVSITVNQAVTSGQTPYLGTAHAVPGTIKASEYDNGGEGVAYHDTTSGFEGSSNFRNDDVDGSASTIGWFNNGEWLEYTADVASAGTYDISVKVSSAYSGGTLRIEFGGVNKTGTITTPGTGSWNTYTSVNVSDVALSAGKQVMRIFKEGGSFNLSEVTITSSQNTAPVANNGSVIIDQDTSVAVNLSANDAENNDLNYAIVTAPANGTLSGTAPNLTYTPDSGFFGSDSFSFKVNDGSLDSNTATVSITVNQAVMSGQTPYLGTAHAVPGIIKASEYDNGGEGVAYHDTTSGFEGSSNFRNDDVDGSASGIAWFSDGEWLEYTVDVASAGTYDVRVKVSSANSGGTFRIEFGGVNKTGTITTPGTGNWGTFTSVNVSGVALSAGKQVMRIFKEGGSFNLREVAIASSQPAQNIALNKAASQSSDDWGGAAARAVDGNTSGLWSDGSITHTSNELSPWWKVNLQGSYIISSITLYNRTGLEYRLSNGVIETSLDGNSWTLAASFSGAIGANKSFPVNVTANHVRVRLNNNGSQRYLSLAEVVVVGTEAQPAVSSIVSVNGSSLEVSSELNTELTVGGNGPLTDEEYMELSLSVDGIVLNEGTFTMTVTTESGIYTFYMTPGEVFDYSVISPGKYSVTYSSSDEIMDLLDILFSDDPILEVKFP